MAAYTVEFFASIIRGISCPKTCDLKIKENVFKVTKKRAKLRGTAVIG